jgi:hypothetical protein
MRLNGKRALALLLTCFLGVARVAVEAKNQLSVQDGYGRVIFAPGLRSLTIYDSESSAGAGNPSHREVFLKKLRAGLEAEQPVRDAYAARHAALEEDAIKRSKASKKRNGYINEEEWEEELFDASVELEKEEEKAIEAAFDVGFASIKEDVNPKTPKANPIKMKNEYQYVGVVNSPKAVRKGVAASGAAGEQSMFGEQVQWYAQKKKKKSNWSLRIMHVDRAAILHHHFQKGKLDFYGRYKNTGKRNEQTGAIEVDAIYSARPRSPLTFWNANPIKYFTDRSGHKERERRIPNGIYTDGEKVYESSYDYHFGRNGMKVISNNFSKFMKSTKLFSAEEKPKVEEKLTKKSPDVVIEF